MPARATCLDEDTIDGLFQAKLSPEELAAIDAHIDTCGDCRVLLSSLAAHEPEVGPFSATMLASQVAADLQAEREREGSDDPRIATGDVLGERFKVGERIGSGGMAEVFRARDARTGLDVAVKVPRGFGVQEEGRFEREAALIVALQHPAIVKHIASGRTSKGTPFLAMEWLDGEDLADRFKRAPLTIDETIDVGERIAGALAAAHAAGVVHRDIKPSNIFLRGKDVRGATLIDFGVARRTLPGGASLVTRTGVLLGTLGYMAPEQALGAKTADARADVFSLGCVLFEALTGRRPFPGAHAVEVLAKLLTETAPSPRSIATDVSPALDALVLRMLSRDPAARPASGPELLAALAYARTAPAPKSRRVPRAAIGAAALVATLGAIAAWRLHAGPHVPVAASPLPVPVAAAVHTEVLPVVAPAPAPTPLPSPVQATTAAAPNNAAPSASTTASRPASPSRAARPAKQGDPFGTSRN